MIKNFTNCEIHWDDYNVYALNVSTMVFENTSGIGEDENLAVVIVEDYDKEIVQDAVEFDIQKIRNSDDKLVYVFYSYDHYLKGYAFIAE